MSFITKLKQLDIITECENIQQMSGYEISKVNKLRHLSRGPEHACMLTHGLYRLVRNNEIYLCGEHELIITSAPIESAIDLEYQATHPANIETPPFLEIAATWDSTPLFSGDENNILGDNGRLFLHRAHIAVPSIIATKETLAFYGATLVRPGELIRFPDSIYPIWSMTINPNYVANYLMTEQGGGFYLEYHQDQPHYHHAIDGAGYYLLAKWNEAKTSLYMTGFQIPNGHAVYTKKNGIHCDAALTGDYLVGYTTSKNCSTVLLHSCEKLGIQVQVNFNLI